MKTSPHTIGITPALLVALDTVREHTLSERIDTATWSLIVALNCLEIDHALSESQVRRFARDIECLRHNLKLKITQGESA